MGHQSLKMTLRYAHLAPDYMRQEIAILDHINGNSGRKVRKGRT
jgi:hypothetical protein